MIKAVIVAGMAVFGLTTCGQKANQVPVVDEAAEASHGQMISRLAEIVRLTDDENIFLGDGKARRLREEVANFHSDVLQVQDCQILFELAVAELNLGNERDAIELLVRARENLSKVGASEGLYYRTTYYLGVAHLRLGETENCCKLPTAKSCIYHLQSAAIHSQSEGSEKAISYLTEFIEDSNKGVRIRMTAVWMLNLAYMTLEQHPQSVPAKWLVPKPQPGDVSFVSFSNVSVDAGVDSFGLAGGAVADDFDSDGDVDLIVSNWDPGTDLKFFKNRGNGVFDDYSTEANLGGIGGGLNLVHADYDNDGDLDVLVLRGAWQGVAGCHPNSLLRNEGSDGKGGIRFVDVTILAGLGDVDYPSQVACWQDFDLDGDLDLFVGNEAAGELQAPCQLFRNEGPGVDGQVRFVDIAEQAGCREHAYDQGGRLGRYRW